MKINPSNEILPHVKPDVKNEKTNSVDSTRVFATVLKEAGHKQSTNNLAVNTPGRVIQTRVAGLDRHQKIVPESSASHLIDTLENYQRVLSDPSANLRQVQPMVDQMRASADELAPLVEKMPEGHTVRGVIEMTLMQMHKEIIRFERGEYV